MKTDWERTAPLLAPSLDVAQAVLRAAMPGLRVHALEPLSGGLANTNLRVRTDGADLVLRLYQRDGAARAKEVALARELAGSVPVAQVLAHGAGDGLGAPWLLMPLVDGVPLDALAGDPGALGVALHDAGRVLARIAARPTDLDGPALSAQAYAGWLAGVLARCDVTRLPAPLAARARAFGARWTPLLDARAGERGLVHCDYNGANLLVRDGAVTAVLDWEFAMAGTPLWDLANMRRHFAAQPPEVLDAFATGYAAGGGHLPERWREQAALLDVVNLADMLAGSEPGSGRARSMAASIAAHLDACGG